VNDLQKRFLSNGTTPVTAVFCHGYDPNEKNWEEVVWGTPERPGRLVRAVVELVSGADLLVLSTSGVCLKGTSSREGEILKQFLFSNIAEIDNFRDHYGFPSNLTTESIREIVKERTILIETNATNTYGELVAVGDFLSSIRRGVRSVILVSSPDHLRIPTASAIWRISHPELARRIFFAPCESLYSGEDASTAVILEPPAVAKIPQIRNVFGSLNDPGAMETLGRVLDNLKDPATMERIRKALPSN